MPAGRFASSLQMRVAPEGVAPERVSPEGVAPDPGRERRPLEGFLRGGPFRTIA